MIDVVDRQTQCCDLLGDRSQHRGGQFDDVTVGESVSGGADGGPPSADQHRGAGVGRITGHGHLR